MTSAGLSQENGGKSAGSFIFRRFKPLLCSVRPLAVLFTAGGALLGALT